MGHGGGVKPGPAVPAAGRSVHEHLLSFHADALAAAFLADQAK